MSEDLSYVEEAGEEKARDNKVWIIVAVVVVVLCCCCVIAGGAGWYLWNNGDEIFGLVSQGFNLLL